MAELTNRLILDTFAKLAFSPPSSQIGIELKGIVTVTADLSERRVNEGPRTLNLPSANELRSPIILAYSVLLRMQFTTA